MHAGRSKVRQHNKKIQRDDILEMNRVDINLNKSPFYHTGICVILNIETINEYDTKLAYQLHLKLINLSSNILNILAYKEWILIMISFVIFVIVYFHDYFPDYFLFYITICILFVN